LALWKLPLSRGEAPQRITDSVGPESQSAVSFDGRWLAYSSGSATATGDLRVVALHPKEGAAPALSLGPGACPRWRRDNRELFFLAGRQLVAAPMQPGVEGGVGKPVPLFDAPLLAPDSLSDFPDEFVVSPDGSRFLFAVRAESEPRTAIRLTRGWTSPASRPGQ
jgi:hypothetical protein